jgi:hypothetical protein
MWSSIDTRSGRVGSYFGLSGFVMWSSIDARSGRVGSYFYRWSPIDETVGGKR